MPQRPRTPQRSRPQFEIRNSTFEIPSFFSHELDGFDFDGTRGRIQTCERAYCQYQQARLN
jgi:hypothetical protein